MKINRILNKIWWWGVMREKNKKVYSSFLSFYAFIKSIGLNKRENMYNTSIKKETNMWRDTHTSKVNQWKGFENIIRYLAKKNVYT